MSGRVARPRSAAMVISSPTPSVSRRHERIGLEQPLTVYMPRNEAASSRDTPSVVWVRSLVPKEKNSALLCDFARPQRRARQLDHRADVIGNLDAGLLGDRLATASMIALTEVELGPAR